MAGQSFDEVKIRFDGSVERFTCDLVGEDDRGVILSWRAEAPLVAGQYQLPAGSVTTAFYWRGRGHNLYRPVDPRGTLVCHRIDIIEPPLFEQGRLTFRDLLLDILVPPDSDPVLQDEDELLAAVTAGLTSAARAAELLTYARDLLARVDEVIAEAEAWLAEVAT